MIMNNVTQVIETTGERIYTVAHNGRQCSIPTTTISGLAADGSVVISRTIDGNHPMARANARERMARKVQDAGFAWLGRTQETETAKAAAVDAAWEDAATPAERRGIMKDRYGTVPAPSTY